MKKLSLYLLLVILIPISAASQDKEPDQLTFRVSSISDLDTVHLNPSWHEYFQQKDFYLSWHWGAYRKLTEVLKMNGSQVFSDSYFNKRDIAQIADSIDMVVKSYE